MPDDVPHGRYPAGSDPSPAEHPEPRHRQFAPPPADQPHRSETAPPPSTGAAAAAESDTPTPYAQGQPNLPPPVPPAQPFPPAQQYPQPFPPAPQYPQPFPPAPQYPQPFPPSPQYPQPFPPAQQYPQPFPPAQQYPQPFPPAPTAAMSTTSQGGIGPPLAPSDQLVAAPAPLAAEPWLEPGDIRAAATIAGVLIVVGILAGILWSAISPHAHGIVVSKTYVSPLEEENWVAADGRFAIITGIIGLVAGAVTWFWRSRRGPVLAAGLAIGAGVGALFTALVGYWLSSGHETGKVNTEIRMKVLLHAHGVIALEAVLALAVYLVGVLFSGPDDLGRPAPGPAREPAGVGATDPPMAGSSPVGSFQP